MAKSKGKTSLRENQITITRVFDAPIDLVWQAWSEKNHLRQWWGQPKGATMPVCEVDFRVGGSLHYKVVLPDGQIVWGKGTYREINKPNRLVFDDCYSDEKGNVVVNADLPQMKISVEFKDLGGKTELMITHSGIGTGIHMADQYRKGWSQCLDRLDDDLAQKKPARA